MTARADETETDGKVATLHPAVERARERHRLAAIGTASSGPASAYHQMRTTTRRGVLFSVIPFAVLIVGLSVFPIPGAIIATGFLTAESAPKQIQSAETAVIREIDVRDGDAVEPGQVLVTLDTTAAAADLAIATRGIDQLLARDARLRAEALGHSEIIFPAELLVRHREAEVAAILAAERSLFALRLEAHRSQTAQMEEQVVQIEEQVKGVEGQIAALGRQQQILTDDLTNLRQLFADQLVAAGRVNEAEQNLAIVEGEQSELNATIALARARRAELGSQQAELEASRMSVAAEEQREVQSRIAELSERQVAARRRVEQMYLTAPVAGIVTDLRVRTVGGVATASETLMTIVPTGDQLIAELKVQPRDIAKVRLGQDAEVHFTTMGGAAAPQFAGRVIYVASDLVADPRTGAGYFVVRVEIDEAINAPAREMPEVGAGMPVEVFLLTEARTVMEYIAKPIFDQARRTFR